MRHPDHNLRCVYVMPNSPAFAELHASYQHVSDRQPWLDVMCEDEATVSLLHADNRTLFAFWSTPSIALLSKPRKAAAAIVYSEPLEPVEAMNNDARLYRQKILNMLSCLDGVFLHTPAMCSYMRALAIAKGKSISWPIEVLPAGLDPLVTVQPDWSCAKDIDFLFYGDMSGKRVWSTPAVFDATKGKLRVTERYGRDLGTVLNRSRVNLYLAHSDVSSSSTWRIWQTLATSAALAVEGLGGKPDMWPLVSWRHYMPLPQLTKENVPEVFKTLVPMLATEGYFAEKAKLAREEIWPKFTAERCVEDWLAPAAARMIEARSKR